MTSSARDATPEASSTQGATTADRHEGAEVPGKDSDTAPQGAKPGRTRAFHPGSAFYQKFAIPFVLLLIFVVFSATTNQFFTSTNIKSMVIGQGVVLLLAVGVTVPLRAGDIDLSVSATMVLSGCLLGELTIRHGVSLGIAVLAALGVGLLVGIVNSIFVVLIGLDALIITLGILTLLSGLASYLTTDNIVSPIPNALQSFGRHQILGLPSIVWIGWVVALILWYVFEFTPVGRYLLFIGGSRQAANLAGLRVTALRCGAFLVSGVISAVAGILLAGYTGAVDPSSGGAYLLPPVAAAFLGTTTIQVGRFNIIGTIVGLYLLAIGISGLQLLGVASWVTNVFNGVALILAITFAKYSGMLGRRRRVA